MRHTWYFEWRLAVRASAVPLGMALLLGAGLVSLVHGWTVIERQRATLRDSPRLQAEEHRHVLAPLAGSANAGDQLYYLSFYTRREPSAWAPVAIGQRDVHAYNLKIRILALQGQLYDSDLGNPLLAAFGNFDLAFVFVVLAPLLVIAVTFDLYSSDVESGVWSLVRSQPVHPERVLWRRYALRGLAVWMPLLVLLGIATVWFDLPIDARWCGVAAATGLYVATWVVVSMLVASARRSSDVNVLALLGVWVVWTALGPAVIHVTAAAKFPMPEALELTVLQRQGYHGAWDEPLPAVMAAFYERYPEWRHASVPHDRYSNAWYYAMQQRGDEAARDAALRYRRRLEDKDAWVARMSWLSPPTALQRLLTRIAGTDLRAYLAYLDSVAAYHEAVKRHFLPVIFRDATVADVNFADAPKHHHQD
jgi:ABC-2 type transport system permease protein